MPRFTTGAIYLRSQLHAPGNVYSNAACRFPISYLGQIVTGDLFSLLTAKPLYRRTLETRDERLSAQSVVLLGFHAWRKLFLGDPQAVEKVAEVDRQFATVIGVMPEQFVMPGRPAELRCRCD